MQGGSTITQQLVRNLYIEDPQETMKRKIIEAHLANERGGPALEGLDPHQVPEHRSLWHQRGRTAVGVQAAAETYFSKHASELTLAQAAMIAGLPQAPSQYNPLLNPRAAQVRRNEVSKAMEEQGDITRASMRAPPARV